MVTRSGSERSQKHLKLKEGKNYLHDLATTNVIYKLPRSAA